MLKTKKDFDKNGEFLKNNLSKIKYLFGLIVCIAGINSIDVIAQGYVLDPTFGNLGKVISSPDGSTNNAAAYGMALQSDGKIVMVGSSGTNPGLFVARYNANGSLDTTFGTNGWTTAVFDVPGGYAYSVDIQPDGKIVVGGTVRASSSSSNNDDLAVARFNADGTLDTTFDGDGKKTISFNEYIPNGASYNERLSVIKVGSDGKIIVAGAALRSTVDDRFIFTRLESNGAIDTSFGTNGILVNEPYTSNLDRITDIVILPGGKFVATARITTVCCNYRMAIGFNVNGSREWIYQQGATQSFGYYNGFDGIAALPDGKFIVGGNRDGKIVAQRLNADGTQDNTFLSPTLSSGQAISVALQSNGKIVANWMPSNGFGDQRDSYNLIRFNDNGSLDTSFGNGGLITTTLGDVRDYARKVFVQPDGKILIGGYSISGSPAGYYFSMMRYRVNTVTPNTARFDYDGDGRADVSVFRPSENKWFILRSSDSAVAQPVFGSSGDIPTPADFDGDGKTDAAVFRPSNGVWWYLSSVNNSQNAVQWGQSGDIPRPSDFDGDGKTDFIVFRPSDNKWYRLGSAGGSSIVEFGSAGDKPLIGDFDGDGKTDPAIYRPSTGVWWYAASGSAGAHRAVQFGISTDTPVPADYDGDGKTDFAFYRPSDGVWHILNSGNTGYISYQFGLSADKPTAADYDGDGKADLAVFRPSTGSWYIQRSTAGFIGLQWGATNDIPTENAFVP